MLMHQLLCDGAARTPDKTALRWVDRGVALSFADAVVAMEHYAGALHELNVRKGDRVTIFAHNGMDYLLGLFACWRIGAIAALVNVRFADELDYYFADHTPSVVIYTHDMGAPVRAAAAGAPSIEHLVCMDGAQDGAKSLPDLLAAKLPAPPDPADENAVAHLSYTSGTTGKPKGACLAHEPTMRACNCIAERLRITPRRRVVRADRAVEFLSARRQSAAAAVARRDRQCDGEVDAKRGLRCAGKDRRNSAGRQPDLCSTRCWPRRPFAAMLRRGCGSACRAAARCREA